MKSSLRFNKFITPKTIKSGVWTLQAPRQSMNIANIQNRSWSEAEFETSGKTALVFVGVKINQRAYQRGIIEAVVLLGDQRHFVNAKWMLQQNSTSVFKAKKTQEWCKVNFPDIISSEE
ncbi:hypothetical protein TNCV_2630861 [Trichonephila clavipes]|nr:hypothetical protein TNCV_2630861 [Trichonephila clavipes]